MLGHAFLVASIVLFAIGALFGATMAILHFMGKSPPPMGLAVLHGVFVLSGFALLGGAVWPAFTGRASLAFLIFGIAAVGGSIMVFGWRFSRLPSAMVLAHGGAALVAFAILLTAFFDF